MNDSGYIEKLKQKLETIDDLELKELIEKLISEREYLSKATEIDPLTGVYNKNILNKIKECNCVVMCDIDNFKSINDNFGHITGDMVVKKIAQILVQNFRSTDYVCRFGGDEFMVGIVRCDKNILKERLEKIKNDVNNSILLPGLNVTISMGVSYANENVNLRELIERADMELYKSKNNGKNMVSIEGQSNFVK